MTARLSARTRTARTSLLCFVLIAALLASVVTAVALPTPSAVSGVVTEAGTANVLAGVEVSIWDDDTFYEDTTTNASGIYAFATLPSNGDYSLGLWKEGYALKTVDVTYSGTPLNVPVQLDPLTPVASGKVTSSQDGTPIQDAWVYVETAAGEPFGYAATDENGDYTIYDEEDAGAASLVFSVYAYDFEVTERAVAWNGSDLLTQNFALTPLFPWTGEVQVVPIEGDTRYETAVEGSRQAFPESGSCDTVVIASGENFPDALGGSALAGALECPVLLTKSGELSGATASEIKRLGAKTAWIIGGTAAVSDKVPATLLNIGVSSQRIAGGTRYTTASLVAEKTVEILDDEYSGDVMFATGENFPDALAASPIAAYAGVPILLVRTDSVPGTTLDTLDTIGATYGLVLGGESAVGPAAFDDLEDYFGPESIMRLAGEDRYETAAIVAETGADWYGLSWGGSGFATGAKFPDALAGGTAQGLMSTVMLLTKGDSVPGVVKTTINMYGDQMNELHFFGGTAAINQAVRTQITNQVKALH